MKQIFSLKNLAVFGLVTLMVLLIPGYGLAMPSVRAQSDNPPTDTPLVGAIPLPPETPVPDEANSVPNDTPPSGDIAKPSITETIQNLFEASQPLQADVATETATATSTNVIGETATPTATNSATPEEKTLFSAAQLQKVHGEGGPDKIFEKVKKDGRMKVIVGLDVAFAPLGRLSPSSRNLQKKNISQAQSKVLNELAGKDMRSVKQFEIVPAMAMEVDEAALNALIASGKVTSIREDIPRRASLTQSVPLIGASTAWSRGYTGSGMTVAILDTGVDKNHSFLSGAVVSEACYSSTYSPHNATTICPGGVESSTASGSAMPYGGTCPSGECDHGTHVAGIAAGYSSTSFAGVSTDANIIAIQVFSRFDNASYCGGSLSTPCTLSYDSDQMLGLQRVYELSSYYNIAAVNLSLGGGYYTSQATCDSDNDEYKSYIDTLSSVNIATIISAGNDGSTNGLSAPGCISSAVSVGATTESDSIASYSNSASFLDLLATGSSITSSVPGGGYGTWNGTSMAAPHVTGAWAILKQARPSGSVSTILNALTTTGVSVYDSRNGITKPRINVNSALNRFLPVGLGTYDDTDANIVFSGNWSADTNGTVYNGTYHYTPGNGSTASLNFTGEGVRVVYSKLSIYGVATVLIDGVNVGTINMTGGSTLQSQLQWSSAALTPGDHTITLVKNSGTYINLDAIIVSGPPPTATDTPTPSNTPTSTDTPTPTSTRQPVGTGTYDDANANIVYSGNWTAGANSTMYNGTYHYSSLSGDTASLTFTGEGIKVVYSKYSTFKTATVRIDGADVGTINMTSTAFTPQLQWSSGALTPGNHTITLVNTSGAYINLDAFIVSGPPPTATHTATATNTPSPTATPAPVGLGTYDDTDTNIVYSGNWTAGTNGTVYNGTYHYTLGNGSSASLTFTGESVKVVYSKLSIYGVATVLIDGVNVDTINMTGGSTLESQLQWSSAALTPGNHTITLVKNSGTYINLDAIIVTEPPPTVTSTPTATTPPTTLDDADASVIFSGSGWHSFIGLLGGPSSGSGHYSTEVNDTVSLSFTGSAIGLIYMGNTNRGIVEIAIDGVTIANLDQNASGLQWQNQWTSEPLTSGSHNITLTHKTGQYVDLDAFLIFP